VKLQSSRKLSDNRNIICNSCIQRGICHFFKTQVKESKFEIKELAAEIEELQDNVNRLRSTVDLSPDTISVHKDGKIILSTKPAWHYSGRKRKKC
jgi:hypothetical protein